MMKNGKKFLKYLIIKLLWTNKLFVLFDKQKTRTNDDDSSEDEEQDISNDEPTDEKPKTIVGVTPVVDDKCRFFLGKDYTNFYQKDYESIEKYDEGFLLNSYWFRKKNISIFFD